MSGFGITDKALIKKPGEHLETASFNLEFIGYPSEMHLWEGLLALETNRKIIFSSDLFTRMGPLKDSILSSRWEEEIQKIDSSKIPSPEALELIKKTLAKIPAGFIAPGHGPCLKIS